MKRTHTAAGLTAALVLSLALGACGDDPIAPVNPKTLEFHPSLEVDFSQMTEIEPTLWIRDLVVGSGEVSRGGDRLTVHYSGYLTDGTLFDDSYSRGQPFVFTLGVSNVIIGWHYGIGGMAVGGRRQLVIPPHMAYGNQGKGAIPPGATLVFVVDLLQACAFDSPEGECL